MSYIGKSLLPGEKILYAARMHSIVLFPGIVIMILGALLAHFTSPLLRQYFGDTFAEGSHKTIGIFSGVVVLVGFVMVMGALIRQRTTELAITNQRIIAKYGFISRWTFEIMIGRITGSNFDQTVLGRIFGYGTVMVHGAGGDISPFDLMEDPQGFHRALVMALESISVAIPQSAATSIVNRGGGPGRI